MVDFSKRLSGKAIIAITDPVELYNTLDRAHDKGPLRPAQTVVLEEWHKSRRNYRDAIVKLHTGQGKTLVGLLMLQSRLNEKKEPVVYLCPNNFLIEQTCEQAKQFGISTCTAESDLPDEFHNGQSILVTSVQKLFNGITKFGLHNKSAQVSTLLMDDAHACSDAVRDACRIRIPKDDPTYNDLIALFSDDLEQQGIGTYADVTNGQYDALLSIPYWAWIQKEADVAQILSKGSARKTIKFAWPLIKDMLGQCQCVVSGAAIEIEPYIPPLEAFGTYWKAQHRIFMSATVTDDAFLIKGLQLKPETIINPLTYKKERWSGEKMILVPALIDESLNRSEVVKNFAPPQVDRKSGGVVSLASSFKNTGDWKTHGALIADANNVVQTIQNLKMGRHDQSVVLVNRYDGIDLSDNACRILVFDGKPFSESLIDLHQEMCRSGSQSTLMKTVRTIEQGLGRSVRGEKDYSVIIIIGTDLTRLLRDKNSRKYLSSQMDTQIEIGLEIADMAKQEIEDGETPVNAFYGLINQCLKRDASWKAFYAEQMDAVKPSGANEGVLNMFSMELSAEKHSQIGDYDAAALEIQNFLDKHSVDDEDKAWYLQEMARYNYRKDRKQSQRLQVSAHTNNRLLLRPPSGVNVTKLKIVSQGRMERIIAWIKKHDDYEQMNIAISDILTRLVFGTNFDKFEQALDDLSEALGFRGERPDKEWKAGPDNLWALDDTHYIVWECKNEVSVNRSEINKREAEQMNRSSAWFDKYYKGCDVKRVIIHPAKNVAKEASFTHDVEVMDQKYLTQFVKAIRKFFNSFETVDFQDLSEGHIQGLIDDNNLSVMSFMDGYTKKPHDLK